MTAMIALALTPAICAISAMVLAMQGKPYGVFLFVAVFVGFCIAGTVSSIKP